MHQQQYFSQQNYTASQPQRLNNPTHQQQYTATGIRQPTANGQHVQYTTQPSESVRIAHGYPRMEMQYNQLPQPQYLFNRHYAPTRQTFAQTQRMLQQTSSQQPTQLPEQTLRNLLDPYSAPQPNVTLNRAQTINTLNDQMLLQQRQQERSRQSMPHIHRGNQLSSPPPLTHQSQSDHGMQQDVSRSNQRMPVETPRPRTNLTQVQIRRQLMSTSTYARVTTPSAPYQVSNTQTSQTHLMPARVTSSGMMQSPPHQRIHITFAGTPPHNLPSPSTSYSTQHHQPSPHDRLSAMESMLAMPQRSFPETKVDTQPRYMENKVVVKRQTSSVHSNNAVFIIRDSDTESETESTGKGKNHNKDRVKVKSEPLAPKVDKRIVIDDDIEITNIQDAEIMSHVRSDCPIHQFTVVNSVDSGPVIANTKRCGKCFCYICDRIATECKHWTDSTCPHCNAHAKASCWKARRNNKKSPLMASLSGEEMTSELRIAAEVSQQYMIRIREAYITYRSGTPCPPEMVPCNCNCHKGGLRDRDQLCTQCKSVHDMRKKYNYAPVRDVTIQTVHEIHAKYSSSAPLSALVMLESILSELCSHRPADFNHVTKNQSNPDTKCQCNTPQVMDQYIEAEFVSILSRHEVPRSFLSKLKRCVETSVQPLQLKDTLKRFLTMRHWGDDHLLRMVLSGGNLKSTKNRDMLRETQDVFNNRIEKLDREGRFQSIIRYIKAVKIVPQAKSPHTVAEREQNKQQLLLLYSAKQGLFRDVCLNLVMLKGTSQQDGNLNFLQTFSTNFTFDLFNILAGYNIPPETKLSLNQSFNSGVSPDQKYVIVKNDATVMLYLLLFMLEAHKTVSVQTKCCEVMCKLVNQTALAPITNQQYLRQLAEVGKSLCDHARQAYLSNQMYEFVGQSQHTPAESSVHMFVAMTATLLVYNTHAMNTTVVQPFIINTMQTFKANEWAFFNLLSMPAAASISVNHVQVLRWLIAYVEKTPNSVQFVKNFNLSTLLVKVIEKCEWDEVNDFLIALIPPDALDDATLFDPVIHCAQAFAARLQAELFMPRQITQLKRLVKACTWLNTSVYQKLSVQNIQLKVHGNELTIKFFQKVGRLCCTLLPSIENFLLLRKVLSNMDWSNSIFQILPFIQSHIAKGNVGIQGLSAVLTFILEAGSEQHFVDTFKDFLEKHACQFEKDPITGAMILDEIARLIEHGVGSINKKSAMVKSCCVLVVHETLSWLICTRCAEKMPLNWVGVWKALTKVGMRTDLEGLNNQAMIQIGSWLKELSLKTSSDYDRLLTCLRRFFAVLARCWFECDFNVDFCQRMVHETSLNIKDSNLQRDYMRLLTEAVNVEKRKHLPPTPTPPTRPTISPIVITQAPKPPTQSIPISTQQQPYQPPPPHLLSQSKPTQPPQHHTTQVPQHRTTQVPHHPTHPPQHLPTQPPQHLPTQSPQYLPTQSPQYLPTQSPQHLPTQSPQHLPTQSPQHLPTQSPQHLPTQSPQHLPTQSPQYLPTHPPQHHPTQPPLPLPTITNHQPGHHEILSTTATKAPTMDQTRQDPKLQQKVIQQNQSQNHQPSELQTRTVITELTAAPNNDHSSKPNEPKNLHNNIIEQCAKESPEKSIKRPSNSPTPPKPTKVPLPANSPFSPTPPVRSKLCPKCGSSVSCASFKCPNCNEVTRSVKTVKCPGCSQENHNLKSYSCMFCYRSLMDVIFNDKKTRDASMRKVSQTDSTSSVESKEKKKRSHKRKKKFKSSDKIISNGISMEGELPSKQDDTQVESPNKKVFEKRSEPSLTNYKETSAASLTDSSSDTDTADTSATEHPPMKRRKSAHISRDNGLKRKTSNSTELSKPPSFSRLSDESDSDSEPPKMNFGGRSWKHQSSAESAKHAALAKWRLSDKIPSAEPKKEVPRQHTLLKITKSRTGTGFEASTATINSFSPSKPQTPPQRYVAVPEAPASPGTSIKKAIGHSSSMSKHQKNILSRMRGLGGGRKVSKTLKSPPLNPKKIIVENLSDETSSAGLSFSLARMAPKNKPSIVQSSNATVTTHRNTDEISTPEHSAWRGTESDDDFTTNKPRKKIKKKKKRTLEGEYNFYLEYRKPGPASKTGYRQLLKLRRKYLREQYRKWNISPDVFVSEEIDLTATCTIPLRKLDESQLHLVKAVVRDDVQIHDLYT